MNLHVTPETPVPAAPITVAHVASEFIDQIEIFFVAHARAPFIMLCHAPTGAFDRMSPHGLSVTSRDKIQQKVDSFAREREIDFPVRWCCGELEKARIEKMLYESAPLDPRRFVVASIDEVRSEIRRIVTDMALHRRRVYASHPAVGVSRISIAAA